MTHVCPTCGYSDSDVRVVRRFAPSLPVLADAPMGPIGAFVDVETTGLDSVNDRIIQAAVVLFAFTKEGEIISTIGEPLVLYNDPGRPIPAEITALTGITDDIIRGADLALLRELRTPDLVIAHNAAFDRPFLEAEGLFGGIPWGCSMVDVPWQEEGLHGFRLDWLAYEHGGFFFDAHRADQDCLAALELLTKPLPSGRNPFALLLDRARQKWVRIDARYATFARKDLLKARGYRWDALQKVWWTELPEPEHEGECAWLLEHIYDNDRPGWVVRSFTARERFSARVS